MASLKKLQQIQAINTQLEAVGMRMANKDTKGAWASISGEDVVVIYPSEKGLPHYARDAELFIGTLDDVQLWLFGIQWMASYIAMIGVDTGTKRIAKEEAERERQLLYALRNGELPKNLLK